jgi:hypothetical protein
LSDEVVKLTEAPNEMEAALICGFLESFGIRATYDKGGVPGSLYGFAAGGGEAYVGRQEILVRADDLEAAREALAKAKRE